MESSGVSSEGGTLLEAYFGCRTLGILPKNGLLFLPLRAVGQN